MKWEDALGAVGLVLLVIGQYMGLFWTPPERDMGDVVRILYVHVPAAWMALLVFTVAFVAALGSLFTGRRGFDWLLEATAEVGVLQGVLLSVVGSIFAKPTFGAWWQWDPRLTTTAILVLTFAGVLVLRSLVTEPDRRATWSAVVAIFAAINVPLTYFSVDWWRSIHQMRSSPETMDDPIVFVLRLNAFAFLFLTAWFVARRYRLARALALREAPPPLPEETR